MHNYKYKINKKGFVLSPLLLLVAIVGIAGFFIWSTLSNKSIEFDGNTYAFRPTKLVLAGTSNTNYALKFNGNGVNGIDRVVYKIDNPETAIDVGATDFTLEWFMKASASANDSSSCTSGGDNWINGNVIIDRDIWGGGDYGDYGVSLYGGRIAFGVHNGSSGHTLCGSTNVANNAWHHIAVSRRASDGMMFIFVDGKLDGQFDGPNGNISYKNGRSTSYNNDPYLVLGAEKHDAGSAYPSYNGYMDEFRISNVLRYTGNYTVPIAPFTKDSSTLGLYHFDEGSGTVLLDSALFSGNALNGTIKYGGNPYGPIYEVSSVFSSTPSPSPTPTFTPTPVPSATAPIPTPTSTITPSPTATATPISTPSPTQSVTPTPSTPPQSSINFALTFDGNDDMVHSTDAIPGLSGSPLTVELWVKPSTNNQNSVVLTNATDVTGWSIELNSGRATFWLSDNGGSWKYVRNSASLKANTWYHIALVHSDSKARVFVNGKGSTNATVGALYGNNRLLIGGLDGYSYFRGDLDEIRISNNSRYTANFTRPSSKFVHDANTLLLLNLNEGSGQVVSDISNLLNLTIGATNQFDASDPMFVSSGASTN